MIVYISHRTHVGQLQSRSEADRSDLIGHKSKCESSCAMRLTSDSMAGEDETDQKFAQPHLSKQDLSTLVSLHEMFA